MTVNVIHSTQYYAEHHKYGYPSQFAVQTIETWQAHSSVGNTPMVTRNHVPKATHSFPVPTQLIIIC